MNRLRFDLKTRPPVVDRLDKEPCGICKRQISRYTCPTCNLPYCSLTCFKSGAHSECSETFYRKEIEIDIKTAPSKSAEERKKMLQILRKFEEENAQDPDVLDEDDNNLAHRLEGMNLDKAKPEVIWSLLSPEQKDSFLKAMRDPSSELAQQLLSSAELHLGRRKPWWESHYLETDEAPEESGVYGIPPRMMLIPRTLTSIGTTSGTSPFLVYNILALCLAYAHATRRLSMSPLSALDPTDPDHAVAQDLISRTAPFLTDRKSTLSFASLDNLVTYTWSRLEALSDPPSKDSFSVLLADAANLLRPDPVAVITQDDPDDPDSQPLRKILLVISDIAALFASSITKPKHVLHKLNFYAGHICAQNPDILRLLAGEVQITGLKMQSQPEI